MTTLYVYLNLRTICYYGIFFPYWNQSGSDMIIKFFFSFVVEIRSRNFNSLKVLNYRQIEKRILDRILSPSIYDNQIRNFRQLYAAINKIWGQISADQSIFENRFFQSFLHSNVFDIYNQNCKYVVEEGWKYKIRPKGVLVSNATESDGNITCLNAVSSQVLQTGPPRWWSTSTSGASRK